MIIIVIKVPIEGWPVADLHVIVQNFKQKLDVGSIATQLFSYFS